MGQNAKKRNGIGTKLILLRTMRYVPVSRAIRKRLACTHPVLGHARAPGGRPASREIAALCASSQPLRIQRFRLPGVVFGERLPRQSGELVR
jgi:hypothetical protein